MNTVIALTIDSLRAVLKRRFNNIAGYNTLPVVLQITKFLMIPMTSTVQADLGVHSSIAVASIFVFYDLYVSIWKSF